MPSRIKIEEFLGILRRAEQAVLIPRHAARKHILRPDAAIKSKTSSFGYFNAGRPSIHDGHFVIEHVAPRYSEIRFKCIVPMCLVPLDNVCVAIIVRVCGVAVGIRMSCRVYFPCTKTNRSCQLALSTANLIVNASKQNALKYSIFNATSHGSLACACQGIVMQS